MSAIKDKVILITGAGKGAGRALAEACAARGARVACCDISPVNVEEVVARVNANGGHAKSYIEDIAKKVGAQALINNVEDDFGRIDVLINHAAVEPRQSLLEMDEWDWHRVLDVNLTGAFLMIQSVGRGMRENHKGTIINLITETDSGVGKESAFAASMAGLAELSQRAKNELVGFGIHVHAVRNTANVVAEVMSILEAE